MKQCNSILAREFWLKNELQSHCCCLFIGFDDGSWRKALYNDETCSWELAESDEVPEVHKPLGDSEFFYPYKQYLPRHIKAAGELTEAKLLSGNKLVISFSGGIELSLLYNPITESEHIEINT